ALVVGLAAWGLMLARQAKELEDLPAATGDRSFRMNADSAIRPPESKDSASRTLDTGFQRLLVAIAGALLLAFGILITYLLYRYYTWSNPTPAPPLPTSATLKAALAPNPTVPPPPSAQTPPLIAPPLPLLSAIPYWIPRPRRGHRDDALYGEPVTGNFTLGI